MIYIQHNGKTILGYSETKHFDNDVLINKESIDLSKVGFYEVVNGSLVFNKDLYEDAVNKNKNFDRLHELKKLLSDSDYKIIKCYEASLVGAQLPYDMVSLVAQRNIWRSEINKLESSL